jgi:hypothetical protein
MPARRGQPFSADERADILAAYRRGWERDQAALRAREEEARKAAAQGMAEAVKRYVDGVPIVPLSRSPFSGEVFETSIDTFGIDGLWWSYEDDFRPFVEPERTLFAWTGAMKLAGPLPEWSLMAMVGPEVPFVLPRMLSHPDVRAVVSAVAIGEHVGLPIVYYAEATPHDLERVDDWGHRLHSFLRADGSPTSTHSIQDDDKDFDLVPWFRRGKLLWIEPGDPELRLRHDPDGCPFIGLQGERRRQYVEGRETWLG